MSYSKTKNRYPQFVKEGELSDDSSTLYSRMLIHKKVVLKIVHIGKSIKQTLEKAISTEIEGKCIIEGYVRPRSVSVLTYSSGIISADNIVFEVVFECLVCSPVEGMVIRCIAKNITKAGIKAEIDETPTPLVIFIARDHHYKSTNFANIKENDLIKVKVIGQRYELNDKYVSVIASLISYEENTAAVVVSSKPSKTPLIVSEPLVSAISAPVSSAPVSSAPTILLATSSIKKKNVTKSTGAPKRRLVIME